jgi:hypothetical protein
MLRLFCALSLFLGGMAVAQAEVNTGIGHTPQNHSAGNHGVPSPHSGGNHQAGGMGDVGQMMQPPAGPLVHGTVISIIPGAGYSYIEATVDGKVTWIAGTPVNAKKGDKIKYVENTVMENFTSRSLNRTFDRIVFASTLSLDN